MIVKTAMTIRTIEFVIVETLIIVYLSKFIPFVENINYLNWIINALMVFILAVIVTLVFNIIFYKNELCGVIKIIKNVLFKKKKNA